MERQGRTRRPGVGVLRFRRRAHRWVRARGRGVVAAVVRPFAADPDEVLAAVVAGELDRARRQLRLLPLLPTTTYLYGRLAEARAALGPADRVEHHRREAVRRYREASVAGLDPPEVLADARLRLGIVLEQLGRHAAATSAYTAAVGFASTPADTWYRLGHLAERRGDLRACWSWCRQGMERDADAPAIARAMLQRSPRQFVFRRQVAQFVVDEWAVIHDQAGRPLHADAGSSAADRAAPVLPDRPVFVYWAQGLDAAPELVQRCVEWVADALPEGRVRVLDRESVTEYVDLPESVWGLADTDRAHFSDVLRVALLARHGGVWLDATCYPGPGFADRIEGYLEHELFAFRYHPPSISSWLLAARPDGYLIRHLDAALRTYWRTRTAKVGYFMLHHVFEALYLHDPEFRRRWDLVPEVSSRPPHLLQHVLREPLADHDLEALIAAGPVHKLTWKIRPDLVNPQTVVGALLARRVAG